MAIMKQAVTREEGASKASKSSMNKKMRQKRRKDRKGVRKDKEGHASIWIRPVLEKKIQVELRAKKDFALKKSEPFTSDCLDGFSKNPAHVHISANMKRLKVFYGFRYEYNSTTPSVRLVYHTCRKLQRMQRLQNYLLMHRKYLLGS